MTNREDDPGTFVVDFEPGLHGPFSTRREAHRWAQRQIDVHGEANRTYGYVIVPVAGLDEVPKAVAA